MIFKTDIEAWVALGEGEMLECKATTGERRAATQTICAMLNHRGGRVLFGVDAARKIVGQDVGARTLEEVANELAEIQPPAFPSIDRVHAQGGRDVIVVTTSTGASRPYTYKGRAYQRVGSTTREMSSEQSNRMLVERLHGEQRWESEIAQGWSIADLDEAEIVRTLEESIRRGRAEDPGLRDPLAIVRALGLARDASILRAGALLFGRGERLESHFAQCTLRVARFRGSDRTEFLDNRQFHGNAFDLLLRAERFLRESLPVAGRITPGLFERADDPLYPPVALREALANAVCHRDYSIGGGTIAIGVYDDRLEVTSSGSLHFGLTAEALFEPHDSLPWNPLVARVLYRRGIIESWGRGTLKMVELTERAGLPRPEIEDKNGCVTVRFRPGKYVAPRRVGHDLSERQQRILEVLGAAAGPMPRREIIALVQARDDAVREDLNLLRKLRLVETDGHGAGSVWFLSEPGRGTDA